MKTRGSSYAGSTQDRSDRTFHLVSSYPDTQVFSFLGKLGVWAGPFLLTRDPRDVAWTVTGLSMASKTARSQYNVSIDTVYQVKLVAEPPHRHLAGRLSDTSSGWRRPNTTDLGRVLRRKLGPSAIAPSPARAIFSMAWIGFASRHAGTRSLLPRLPQAQHGSAPCSSHPAIWRPRQ